MYCIYKFSTYKITSFSKERALLEKDQTQLHFEFLTVTIYVACVADVWMGREIGLGAREKRVGRARRVSLAPDLKLPFPSKRLPSRLRYV